MFDYMKLIKECEKGAKWYDDKEMYQLSLKYMDLQHDLAKRFHREFNRYLNE